MKVTPDQESEIELKNLLVWETLDTNIKSLTGDFVEQFKVWL